MQDTTVAFVASVAFGDEPNPPNLNLEIPAYSGRKLPPEIMTVSAAVAPDSEAAEAVAERFWQLHSQPIDKWTAEVTYPG